MKSSNLIRSALRRYDQYSDVLQKNGEPTSVPDDAIELLRRDETQIDMHTDDNDHLVDNMHGEHVLSPHSAFAKHCHHAQAKAVDKRAEHTLLIVSLLTVTFMCGEFVGGYLSGSLAVMTDAGHLMSDLFSFVISLASIYISRWPATKRMSFGFHRTEVLAALVSILVIWVITAVLVYLAVLRLVNGMHEVQGTTMAITAAAAVVFNIIMGVVLHFGGASHAHSHGGLPHSHGHSHSETSGRRSTSPIIDGSDSPSPDDLPRNLRDQLAVNINSYPGEEVVHTHRRRNINVRAAFVHVLGDLLQSVGVLVAALVVWWKPEYKFVDPICTFVFSILVLFTTMTVLRDALLVLLEATPRDVDYSAIKADLQSIAGVRQVHSLHLWSLTMDKAALAVHLAIDESADALEVQTAACDRMRRSYNLSFTTVQVEPFVDEVMHSCSDCIGPLS